MAKDRSRPFSRKHFRYWMTVTGGMLLIGSINVVAGWLMWPGEPQPTQPIVYDVPQVDLETAHLGAIDAGVPAGRDAAAATTATPSGS